ncbi:NACHT domain-containing NTPase [Salmonella enterica]
MLNRQVRQIYPQEARDGQTKTFGDYSESPNIVLLGDPGAGKTHLFKQFSAFHGANYLTARHFLSGVPIDNQKALFIDALDEKRSSHNSSDVIDGIVQRLFSQTSQKVRISCRSQDWLGESDLSAFLPYFEQTGGYVVLHLQQLSREEQTAILHAHGIEHPEKFLEEAEKHSAYEFLHNPQNLLMLAEAVKEGNWPRTRSALFHSATQLLLTEHSKEHTRQDSGIYTSNELEHPAGSICALRILSDVSGISLLPNDIRPEYPSYRTIPFFSHEIIRATLSRRVFSAGDELETVDYSHRTIAEYLAAKWLASIVEKGLPLGRLRSLLGFEGYPSSELRGLHAWLAVFLPQYTIAFIEADPYGVLTYGDAASLSTVDKQSLLVALSKLSERDPWFRNHGFSSNLNGFVSEEMEAHLRLIIHDRKSRFSLRMLILESLSVTTPILSLNQDLIDIVKSERHSYAEKEEAITALIHSGLSGIKEVIGIYSELKEISHDNIRLRNHIIQLLYKDYFSALDVAQLLTDTLLSVTEERLPVGALWGIIDIVPAEDIMTIFEYLYQYQNENIDNQYSSSINRHEILYYIERGLVIILNTKDKYTAEQIWICLSVHYWYKEHYSHYENKKTQIVLLLKEREWQYADIIDAAVASFSRYNTMFLFLNEFEQSTFGVIPRELLLSRFIHYLSNDEKTPEKARFIYCLAFPVLWNCGVPSQKVFEYLISYGLFNNELSSILEDALICEIEDWQVKNSIRRLESEKEKRNIINSDKLDFQLHREQIVSGVHKGWLKHIAYIYYARYSDVDEKQTYSERLSSAFGDENVMDSISGLIATLQRQDLPTLDDVNAFIIEGRYYEWWFSILAGAEELWKRKPDITQWPEGLLKLLLALELGLGKYIQNGRKNNTHLFEWKKQL